MKKTIFVFSSLIMAIFLLLKLSSYSLHSGQLELEIGIGLIALVFFFVGLWIQKQSKTKNSSDHDIDKDKIAALEITKREYDVLKGIAEGLSNKEIGAQLFLSESTVKTHVSSLLLKLNAKRRTQALQIAKSHKII